MIMKMNNSNESINDDNINVAWNISNDDKVSNNDNEISNDINNDILIND